jgi:hypothetical protein
MGNITSSNKKAENEFENFYDIIDYIATYYILTMDFQSLSKLSEKAYCDKLVILTSDIVDRYFNDTQVTFLEQRIKNGLEVNNMKTENIRYINKDTLESLDVSNDTQKSIRKKRICIGIAKFYVKIAHIFAAIVMTINPVYTYQDVNGQSVKTTLLEKDKIPKNVNRKLFRLNICDNRIRALKKGENIDEKTGNVTIHPQVCDINIGQDGLPKTLENEPGIPELLRLYLDDKYDYSTGSFLGMSEESEKQFRKDLKTFYTAFTGNQNMPDTIKNFSDIKLRDYSKKPGCQSANPVLKSAYTINKKNDLFLKYADNIKSMIQSAADNQYKLLEVINELFTYVIDPYTSKRVIRINPRLTDLSLQKAVEKTRKLIVNLYVKCETDYVNGVQIFEAIVESKILETTQKQIENLKKETTKIIEETKKVSQPIKKDNPLVASQNMFPEPSLPKPVEDVKIDPLPNVQINIKQNLELPVKPSMPSGIQPSMKPSMQPNVQLPIEPNMPSNMKPSMQPNVQLPLEPNMKPSIQSNVQLPLEPNMKPIMQSNVQLPVEPNMSPSMKPTMQSNMRPTMQPNVQLPIEPSMKSNVQLPTEPTMQSSMQSNVQLPIEPSMPLSMKPSMQPSMKPNVKLPLEPNMSPSMQSNVQPHVEPSMPSSMKPNMQPPLPLLN